MSVVTWPTKRFDYALKYGEVAGLPELVKAIVIPICSEMDDILILIRDVL